MVGRRPPWANSQAVCLILLLGEPYPMLCPEIPKAWDPSQDCTNQKPPHQRGVNVVQHACRPGPSPISSMLPLSVQSPAGRNTFSMLDWTVCIHGNSAFHCLRTICPKKPAEPQTPWHTGRLAWYEPERRELDSSCRRIVMNCSDPDTVLCGFGTVKKNLPYHYKLSLLLYL